jgi:hypothetical protein
MKQRTMKHKNYHPGKLPLWAAIVACLNLLVIGSHGQALSNIFDVAIGQNTYTNMLTRDGSSESDVWVNSFAGMIPRSGTSFFASANGNTNITFLSIGLTKVLGGTIEARPYLVSFFVAKYNDRPAPASRGVEFADFLSLRIGGMDGTMLWSNTPTPVVDGQWVQWSGIYTPAPADVGKPFLFHAVWDERPLVAIAIDGPMVARPTPPVLSIGIGCVDICLDALAGRSYQLEYQSAATTNQWVPVLLPFSGTGSRTCIVDNVRGEPQRIYRVREL